MEQRAGQVTLSGDVSGEYVVAERRDDGSLVLVPADSAEAMRQRLGLGEPASLEEFEAQHGAVLPPDGEG